VSGERQFRLRGAVRFIEKNIVVAISLAREIVDADDWTDVLERRQENAPAGSVSGSRKGRVSRAR